MNTIRPLFELHWARCMILVKVVPEEYLSSGGACSLSLCMFIKNEFVIAALGIVYNEDHVVFACISNT